MARQWTEAQTKAIETRGCNLLVSAGAGSGKTAVLTERIIRRLTDKTDPAEINRMLIVTFTKAAAGELRERISGAVSDALSKAPKNRRLARQLLSLENASICTIHSFCLDILRESGIDANLPSDFRIADAAEIKLLRNSLMNELIEDYHQNAVKDYPIDNFPAFADAFVGTKSDDGLADVFLDIEESLSGFTEHIEFIRDFADELRNEEEDFMTTRCGGVIVDLIISKLSYYWNVFDSVLPEIFDVEKLKKAYFESFTSDMEFIDNVLSLCLSPSYDSLSCLFNFYTPKKLGIVKNDFLSKELIKAKDLRTEFHSECKKIRTKFFSLTSEQLNKNRLDTADSLNKLYTLLCAFLDRFNAEKRSRSIVDFGDLERHAYRMLIKDGKPTPAALSIAQRFDEIYIDEYQDVNAVQDAIFAAVSKGNNRFMVGDIKQSIYGFRGAEPSIFADYRSRFPEVNAEGPEADGKTVFLQNNFRCDKTVIDFANAVSGCLFTSAASEIPFTEGDLLIHSKSESESGEPVRVVLVDSFEADDGDSIGASEAEYVAREIKRLLRDGRKNDGTPIRPSDIAILMRSAKAFSDSFEAAFKRHGIPLYNGVEADFFENAEVLLALCILNIIDNPTKDIYLAGAMKSPVFGFTLDELINIRRHTREGCLYDALKKYTEENGYEKGKEFLETLEKWRVRAEGMPVDRLVWYIYTETDLLSLVYDSESSVRRANLMLLYEYARRFEASSFKGLYNFIRYIDDVLSEKAQLENAKVVGEADDTVKLMTIHQSKGLEFPVCFICGTGKKFNENDLRANIVIERSLGIALKLSDSTGFARYDTPIRQAIVKRMSDVNLEEEMRVLYVAMTRARERLYVTAQVSDPKKLLENAADNAAMLSTHVIMKNGGYIQWILTAMAHHKRTSTTPLAAKTTVVGGFEDGELSEAAEQTDESLPAPAFDAAKLISERFDFLYPHTAMTKLPAKLSVSKLVPNLLDDDAAELEDTEETAELSKIRPKFMEDGEDNAAGAERGTATHLFMQFCDFSRFSSNLDRIEDAVKAEAARLAEKGFFTKQMASLINTKQVSEFFRGGLFSVICASKRIYREHRFNVSLPASDFTENPELADALKDATVLVQGVIDCFFENSDGTITLVDYKTDYVPKEMPRDDARRMLLDRHRLQLTYYKSACERISARRVSKVIIYSFSLGEAVEVVQ